MNYIYDIYLNLNNKLYDFFDWNKNDKLIHIKKIPTIRTNKEILKNLICNRTKISDDLLVEIYNKVEIWNTKSKIPYCALFTDGCDVIAIEFDSKGNSIRKSYLFIDEELEVLESLIKMNEKDIQLNILCKEKLILKTRKQIKEEKFIYHELKNIEDNKLNYIYFECFGRQEKNKKVILDNINKISKSSIAYKNLYDILKLTSKTKK